MPAYSETEDPKSKAAAELMAEMLTKAIGRIDGVEFEELTQRS